ncbi:hypothetical protein Aperf_G00000049850 [Anoplocephala perfoliata]
MNTTAKIWDMETGKEISSISGHRAEVIALHFLGGEDRRLLMTGSFDHTASLWDLRTGQRVRHLTGHSAEVAAAAYTFDGRLVATASMDKTVRDMRMRFLMSLLIFFVIASTDATAILWNIIEITEIKESKRLTGHGSEVNKVCFSSRGSTLMTASSDKTARLWDTSTGNNRDVLIGHTDEVFS